MQAILPENKLNVLINVPPTSPEDVSKISSFVIDHFSHQQNLSLKILEAGCGQKWALDLQDISYELIGVDLSQDAIELRQKKHNDLDQAIVGDLVSVEFPDQEFHIIYTSYVLEHVDGAEKALENFYRWLKPGGLLIIRIPDPATAYSFLAKSLPFSFHVLSKRLMGAKNAGKPGYDPFPTYFDAVVSRDGIHQFCRRKNLKIRVEYSYGYETFSPFYPIADWILKILGILSLGKLDANRTDLLFIIEK